jgi:hypothetical protein
LSDYEERNDILSIKLNHMKTEVMENEMGFGLEKKFGAV